MRSILLFLLCDICSLVHDLFPHYYYHHFYYYEMYCWLGDLVVAAAPLCCCPCLLLNCITSLIYRSTHIWGEGRDKKQKKKSQVFPANQKEKEKSIHLPVERKRERRLEPRAGHYCVKERKKLHYGDIDTSIYNGSPLSCSSYSYNIAQIRIQRAALYTTFGIRFSLWQRYSLRLACCFSLLMFIRPFFILHSIPWCYYQSTFDISIHIAAASSQQLGCYIGFH